MVQRVYSVRAAGPDGWHLGSRGSTEVRRWGSNKSYELVRSEIVVETRSRVPIDVHGEYLLWSQCKWQDIRVVAGRTLN